MKRSSFYPFLILFAVLLGSFLFGWSSLWVRYIMHIPAEQVYLSVPSPDGVRVAHFSVKYQGIHPWFPIDIEPYPYITVVELEHGSFETRLWEYHGYLQDSFLGLAQHHAPWAVEAVKAYPWP